MFTDYSFRHAVPFLSILCVDLCLAVCGDKPGVVCEGDKSKRDDITCTCSDKGKVFDQEEKECKFEKGTKSYYSLKGHMILPFFFNF